MRQQNINLLKGIREEQEVTEYCPCPRCGNNLLRKPLVLNPLSRLDNKTYICYSCGSDESMESQFPDLRLYMPIEKWWVFKVRENMSKEENKQI